MLVALKTIFPRVGSSNDNSLIMAMPWLHPLLGASRERIRTADAVICRILSSSALGISVSAQLPGGLKSALGAIERNRRCSHLVGV